MFKHHTNNRQVERNMATIMILKAEPGSGKLFRRCDTSYPRMPALNLAHLRYIRYESSKACLHAEIDRGIEEMSVTELPGSHSIQTESQKLRSELKEWERSFAATNAGRTAGREDIKQHPTIGRKSNFYGNA